MVRKQKKKFFIKEAEALYTVTDEFFDDIQSRAEALMLAIRAIDELHLTLKEEALEGDDVFIGNMKVTTGLQRSLEELDKRWPNILDQIYSSTWSIDGRTIICS
jgi:hypothetical protein